MFCRLSIILTFSNFLSTHCSFLNLNFLIHQEALTFRESIFNSFAAPVDEVDVWGSLKPDHITFERRNNLLLQIKSWTDYLTLHYVLSFIVVPYVTDVAWVWLLIKVIYRGSLEMSNYTKKKEAFWPCTLEEEQRLKCTVGWPSSRIVWAYPISQ